MSTRFISLKRIAGSNESYRVLNISVRFLLLYNGLFNKSITYSLSTAYKWIVSTYLMCGYTLVCEYIDMHTYMLFLNPFIDYKCSFPKNKLLFHLKPHTNVEKKIHKLPTVVHILFLNSSEFIRPQWFPLLLFWCSELLHAQLIICALSYSARSEF